MDEQRYSEHQISSGKTSSKPRVFLHFAALFPSFSHIVSHVNSPWDWRWALNKCSRLRRPRRKHRLRWRDGPFGLNGPNRKKCWEMMVNHHGICWKMLGNDGQFAHFLGKYWKIMVNGWISLDQSPWNPWNMWNQWEIHSLVNLLGSLKLFRGVPLANQRNGHVENYENYEHVAGKLPN